jgi:hypothetical protein
VAGRIRYLSGRYFLIGRQMRDRNGMFVYIAGLHECMKQQHDRDKGICYSTVAVIRFLNVWKEK